MPAVSQADGEPPHTGHAPAADVLTAERAYLLQSREFLHLMREDVLSLRALGGDPISEEYLKAELYHRSGGPGRSAPRWTPSGRPLASVTGTSVRRTVIRPS